MFLTTPPVPIAGELFARMPDALRRDGRGSDWVAANKPGQRVECFLEGPCFDAAGRLHVVDIPYGRVFRIEQDGGWTCLAEYDGEPNGLAFHPDGRLLIADYRRGLLALDPAGGEPVPLLPRRNSESFKGLNDLIVDSRGAIYFTDQGQTGLHDPTGRVFRLRPDGRLDCLIANGPSPNGLVLSPDGHVLFVAMTRDNAVWRAPLLPDGSVTKVGRFCSLFGTSGPDGLAMAPDGTLAVAHASLGRVFLFAPNGECRASATSGAGITVTNVAIGPDGRHYATESQTGSVFTFTVPPT